NILRDLCTRFINRHLFKYTEFDPLNDAEKLTQLQTLFQQAGLDPNYYLVVDSSADLPYDVYRPGGDRVPIYVQVRSNELKDLATDSVSGDAITGTTRQGNKLYFPDGSIQTIDNEELKKQINELRHYR